MIKLGVIGYGDRSNGVVRNCLRQIEPDLRVTGIVDPDEKGVRARLDPMDQKDVVFYKTLPELVRKGKPDALLIGTRCHQHTPYAIEASRFDLPLYLEKPVSISMGQAQALEKAFRKTRCKVVVSFPLRVSALCVLAKELIDQGAVGSAEHILGVNYVPYGTCYFEAGYRNYKITQGLFLQKATHDLDYMSYLMGSNIVEVAAIANVGRVFGGKKAAGLTCYRCGEKITCLESSWNRLRNPSINDGKDHLCDFSVDCGSPETGMNEDSSSALLRFASGAHGVYTQVFFTRRIGIRGATISGYHGTVIFDWYENVLKHIRHHVPFTDTVKPDAGLSHFGGDHALAVNFIDIIKRNIKSTTPIEFGLQSVYTCLAAKASAETGRFVKVRQVGR